MLACGAPAGTARALARRAGARAARGLGALARAPGAHVASAARVQTARTADGDLLLVALLNDPEAGPACPPLNDPEAGPACPPGAGGPYTVRAARPRAPRDAASHPRAALPWGFGQCYFGRFYFGG
mgnify:CR=1 FL=1|jgi:hypothetical protein